MFNVDSFITTIQRLWDRILQIRWKVPLNLDLKFNDNVFMNIPP